MGMAAMTVIEAATPLFSRVAYLPACNRREAKAFENALKAVERDPTGFGSRG